MTQNGRDVTYDTNAKIRLDSIFVFWDDYKFSLRDIIDYMLDSNQSEVMFKVPGTDWAPTTYDSVCNRGFRNESEDESIHGHWAWRWTVKAVNVLVILHSEVGSTSCC